MHNYQRSLDSLAEIDLVRKRKLSESFEEVISDYGSELIDEYPQPQL